MSGSRTIMELGPENGVTDGVGQVVRATRYQIKHGAKVIKISATAGVLMAQDLFGSDRTRGKSIRSCDLYCSHRYASGHFATIRPRRIQF
jgi:hypothetical protein